MTSLVLLLEETHRITASVKSPEAVLSFTISTFSRKQCLKGKPRSLKKTCFSYGSGVGVGGSEGDEDGPHNPAPGHHSLITNHTQGQISGQNQSQGHLPLSRTQTHTHNTPHLDIGHTCYGTDVLNATMHA